MAQPQTQHAGRRIARFKAESQDTPFSAQRMNEIVDSLNALNNINITHGDRDDVQYSDANVVLQMSSSKGGGDGGGGSTKQYRLVSVQSDHITCQEWDGATLGATTIIAKPAKLRNTIGKSKFFRDTANEVNVDYTYGAGPDDLNAMRVYADDFGGVEVQMVIPIWLVDDESSFAGGLNDLIYAQSVDHTGVLDTGGVECTKLMCSDRQWARVDDAPPTITAAGLTAEFSAVNAAEQMGIQVTSDVPVSAMVFTGTNTNAGYDLGNTSTPTSITLMNLAAIDPDCSQNGGLEIYGNTGLETLNVPKLMTVCGTVAVYNNDSLSSLDFSSLVSAGDIVLSGASISSVALPALVPPNGMPFNAAGCPLDQPSVDGILAQFVSNGSYASGVVNLAGDCSAPSVTGYGYASTLTSRGATVLTN